MSRQQRQGDVAVDIPLQPLNGSTGLRRIFDKYDTDHDGRLSLRELRMVLESREYEHDIPERAVLRIMEVSDRDSSGYLDFQEFQAMVQRPELNAVFGHLLKRYINTVIPRRQYGDATDGQYEEEYSCWPPPVCMLLLSLVEVVLFSLDAATHHTIADGPAANALIYNPYKRHEAWRFLSYMFVHVGWMHLIVNLMVQMLLGVFLEMVHRWWRVLLVYGAGVVAGSLGTSITDPNVFLAGASGGVYALIAAHLATIVLNWSEMEYAVWQLLVFLLLAVMDVGTAIYERYVLDIERNVGYVAHLAGAVAGLLVGIGVLRNLEVRSWEKKLWWVAVVVYFTLMILAVLLNVFWTEHFPETRYNYK